MQVRLSYLVNRPLQLPRRFLQVLGIWLAVEGRSIQATVRPRNAAAVTRSTFEMRTRRVATVCLVKMGMWFCYNTHTLAFGVFILSWVDLQPALEWIDSENYMVLEAWAHANGLHDGPEAIVYAASMPTAREVFSGAPGLVKLIAWANSVPNLTMYEQSVINTGAAVTTPANVFTGAGGLAKLDAWAIANGYTKA